MLWRSTIHIRIVLFLAAFLTLVSAGDDGKCSSSASYYCPNCGGYYVSDCLECDGYFSIDPDHDICYDRTLFSARNVDPNDPDDHYHVLWRDIVGIIVWFIAAGVATACGVGGGGIYVPLGIILLGFAPKPSSGLSQSSIFGASLGGLLLNLKNLHPNETIKDGTDESKNYTRPLIDYDMALFLAPMEMAGAVLGVLIQKILPNWLYLSLAAIILAFTAYKTYMKYFSTRKAEREAAAKAEEERLRHEEAERALHSDSEGMLEPEDMKKRDVKKPAARVSVSRTSATQSSMTLDQQPTEEFGTEDEDSSPSSEEQDESSAADQDDNERTLDAAESGLGDNEEVVEDTEEMVAKRRELLEQDMRQYPIEKLGALIVLWIGLILLTFLKGGKGVESLVGITCESPWYGVLIAIQFVWTLGFASLFGYKLIKRQAVKDACNYPVMPTDVVWDRKKLRFYAFFTFIAGIVAGLIGIGGGMVLGPLMLVMGIHPRVSSATTATMIVLTSSSVAVLFVTSGLVPWEYALTFFGVCFCGAYIGKKYIDGYIKRTGRASLLIFLLATIIALATIGCLVIVLMRLADAGWCLQGFQKFCTVDGDSEACIANRLLMAATSGSLDFASGKMFV